MPIRPVLLFLLTLLLMTHASLAVAGEPDIDKKLWMPIGINFGYTWTDKTADGQVQDSGFLGTEISFVMTLESSMWFGAYFDAIFPLEAKAASARISYGPEFGFALFGIDGGHVVEYYDGNASNGIQVRFLLYWLVGGIYVRGGALWRDDQDGPRGFSEVGMLFKIPLN